MPATTVQNYIKNVLANQPVDWLKLTTHRLDIYNEKLAKVEFLDQFENFFQQNVFDQKSLSELPTAYDYIRLGHPLSSVLEWSIAKMNNTQPNAVISFSSKVAPLLAVLRKNLLDGKRTRIYTDSLPDFFNVDTVRNVYGYDFEILSIAKKVDSSFEGSTVLLSEQEDVYQFDLSLGFDFYVNMHPDLGSVIFIHGEKNANYISEIQHVRRRETIAMTPSNCVVALQGFVGNDLNSTPIHQTQNKALVLKTIQEVNGVETKALAGSSGLSIQYAIMMGLIDYAQEHYPGKAIKFIVPTNCYGGTNDQARRVAACLEHVEVVDLLVDGNNDMVSGLMKVLTQIAAEDAVPFIIAEIPTNPRVEVPDLVALKETLSATRLISSGETAIDPVFILDQTFCPNVHFLGEGKMLSTVRTIAYASGSKFPSGGKCTAGYCIGNKKSTDIVDKIEQHLLLCDNEATAHQYEILAEQMPSMIQRIADAYANTRAFVNHIQATLPEAKINFVSEELAAQGFTPSVFSLDLPTKGATDEERENYKRAMNLKLINSMITQIPDESKYCVSYGQLKGCYWTIPATSTQGTTKESDKDYIARVAVSPDFDLEHHKQVFSDFVATLD
jgi:cystathionine beta-lyase/cystathionine gamma-synthase